MTFYVFELLHTFSRTLRENLVYHYYVYKSVFIISRSELYLLRFVGGKLNEYVMLWGSTGAVGFSRCDVNAALSHLSVCRTLPGETTGR